MNNLSKKEKLEKVLEKVSEFGFSAYEISKEVNLTEAGIARILKGIAKNPHENSINEILLFLEKKVLGSQIGKLEEEKPIYAPEPSSFDIEKNRLVICLTENNDLTREIMKLQGLLRKNNIEFKDIFNEE